MLKPGKVGLELCLTPWRVVLSSGIGAEGHEQRAALGPYSAPGKGLSSPEPCSKTEA
ncbi:Tubulin monoglycylase TTLL3 [Cricetulus griseus]|nr:Tubulin monoglycylase TTLL3 [Cricetulus griseus]